jgi:glycosyltransferase involved in cell wall biosynthesis
MLIKPRSVLKAEAALEKVVVERAAAVICTNGYFRDALAAQYPHQRPEKFHVVHNGYDESDFEGISGSKKGRRPFVISYIGTFYIERTPELFLKALRLFLDKGGIASTDVKVRFIGDVNRAKGVPVHEMVKRAGLSDVVDIQGHVSYREAIQFMASSDVLLLLAPNQALQVPAKTYEYIGSRKPILLIAEEGATAALVEALGVGERVPPGDMDGMVAAIGRLYEEYLKGFDRYAGKDLSKYQRCAQVGIVKDILESAWADD